MVASIQAIDFTATQYLTFTHLHTFNDYVAKHWDGSTVRINWLPSPLLIVCFSQKFSWQILKASFMWTHPFQQLGYLFLVAYSAWLFTLQELGKLCYNGPNFAMLAINWDKCLAINLFRQMSDQIWLSGQCGRT